MAASLPTWTDCHVHLQDAAFDGDRAAVLERAGAAGVVRWVCNGTRESDWPKVRALARTQPGVYPCFGLHPWHVATRSVTWLETLAASLATTPSAVGEIGLDRWIEPRDEADQETVFRQQLDLARRLRRPAMIHCLRAWDWLLHVLKTEPPLPAGLLIHAFGGPLEVIPALHRHGAYFSFAGTVLDPRKARQRESLRQVPPDRLLLETDAPDLLPPAPWSPHVGPPHRGRARNEPANLASCAGGIAAVLGESPASLAARVGANADRLFGAWGTPERATGTVTAQATPAPEAPSTSAPCDPANRRRPDHG